MRNPVTFVFVFMYAYYKKKGLVDSRVTASLIVGGGVLMYVILAISLVEDMFNMKITLPLGSGNYFERKINFTLFGMPYLSLFYFYYSYKRTLNIVKNWPGYENILSIKNRVVILIILFFPLIYLPLADYLKRN